MKMNITSEDIVDMRNYVNSKYDTNAGKLGAIGEMLVFHALDLYDVNPVMSKDPYDKFKDITCDHGLVEVKTVVEYRIHRFFGVSDRLDNNHYKCLDVDILIMVEYRTDEKHGKFDHITLYYSHKGRKYRKVGKSYGFKKGNDLTICEFENKGLADYIRTLSSAKITYKKK